MGKAIKLWRADTNQCKPVLVNCPQGGYPALDEDRVPVRETTHFQTQDEAWESLEAQLRGWLADSSEKLRQAHQLLEESKREGNAASRTWATFIKNKMTSDSQKVTDSPPLQTS